MTQEEKARAYDEALKKIQPLYEQAKKDDNPIWSAYEYLFPQLRESEDEMTRNEIIAFIEQAIHRGGGTPISKEKEDKWLAYLEKQKEPEDKGEISDGYHTFNELYYYRMLYNAAFFNLLPKEWVHKSKKHHDGEECFGGGWFIVMANLPTGQVSNHYELKDWDLFQIPEKEIADEWDGHTPQEAAERLHKYLQEEQKEQKHPDGCFTCDEYKKGYEAGRLNGFTAGYNKTMKEQKSAEWSEDYQEEDIQTRFAFYTYKDDPSVLYLSNVFVEETSRNHGFGTRILRAAEKVAETIGATTISLKAKQDSPENAWYRKNGYGYVAFEDGYDWLEKNLEYMKPNKQEWSEEDEKIRNLAIEWAETMDGQFRFVDMGSTDFRKIVAWLKSRPSWKPSEHQMNILKAVKEYVGRGSGYWGEGLGSLIEDLEKLI